MRALKLRILPVTSARHAAAAAAADGTGVALAGYESSLAVLDVIAIGGTAAPTVTYVLQESDVLGSGYTNVTTADMGEAQPVAFSAAGLATRTYYGSKRFLRWRLDALTGTSPTSTASGTITLGNARHQPAGVTQVP